MNHLENEDKTKSTIGYDFSGHFATGITFLECFKRRVKKRDFGGKTTLALRNIILQFGHTPKCGENDATNRGSGCGTGATVHRNQGNWRILFLHIV